MVRHCRNFVEGGTFFFTLTLLDRASRALIGHIEALRASVKQTRASHPFAIDAIARRLSFADVVCATFAFDTRRMP